MFKGEVATWLRKRFVVSLQGRRMNFVQEGGGADPCFHFLFVCSKEKPAGSSRPRRASPSLPASPAEQQVTADVILAA